jgi:DNA-binding NarL/FixJ family response regulator
MGSLFAKLQVENRSQAIVRALKAGMVTLQERSDAFSNI